MKKIKELSLVKNIKKHKKQILITLLALVLITISLLLFFNIKGIVKFKLIGEENIETNVLKQYKDKGAKLEICHFNNCKPIKTQIKTENKVKTKKLGEYKVTYKTNYKNKKYTLTRTVNVVDKEKPVIKLNGDKKTIVCPGKKYEEEGFTAIDNYDGDLTKKVKIKTSGEKISYTVADSSKNKAKVNRNLVYKDNTNPTITLQGGEKVSLETGNNYNEPGYSAMDICDGDLTKQVKITNNVDNNKVGTYYVNYEVTDKAGNTKTLTRTVVVYGYDFDTSSPKNYMNSLNTYLKSKGYKVSVGYLNLKTGDKYTYNENQVYYGASLIKTLDALYIYENAAKGKIDLNKTLTYTKQYQKDYSDGMAKHKYGDKVTLRELVKHSISVSDNSAHVMLIDYIGFNNLKKYGNSLGGKYTLVGTDKYGQTTVGDQLNYIKKLYDFTNKSSNGKELKQYFINDYYNYLIYDGLPTTAHKYGFYNSYFHDSGIVYDKSPYIITILSNGNYSTKKEVFQDISKRIYGLNKVVAKNN